MVVEGGERADREPVPGRVIPSEGSDSDLRRVLYGIMVAMWWRRLMRRRESRVEWSGGVQERRR